MQLQEAQLQKRITVREAVGLWASLYRTAVDGDRLLEQLGLGDKRDAWFMTLSGGQKQRLLIALALINDPEVVFLDELTTGLDPQARRTIWELVRGMRARGKTVFLTTHLMEEAERLCDRVAIIDHGRARRHRRAGGAGPPALPGDDRGRGRRRSVGAGLVPGHPGGRLGEPGRRAPTPSAAGPATSSRAVIGCLAEHRLQVQAFRTVDPTLEDVFLELTGHAMRD